MIMPQINMLRGSSKVKQKGGGETSITLKFHEIVCNCVYRCICT